jgi:L-alanine-DL-glutamate epimerase-like enolase superfamily enzyme
MALDQPLHDLAGRILGQRCTRSWGREGRDRCRSSGVIYFDDRGCGAVGRILSFALFILWL